MRLFRLAHPAMDRRRLVLKFKQVPELIVVGNAKPFRSPYAVENLSLDLAEVQYLRYAGHILGIHGEVALEDFAPKKGVRLLCDLFDFSDRLAGDSILHLLVSLSLQSYALTAFSGHYESIPVEHREALIERIHDLLNRPTMIRALEGERRYTLPRVRDYVYNPQTSESDSPEVVKAKEKLRDADAAFREENLALALSAMREVLDEMTRIAKRSDLEWMILLNTNEPPNWSNLLGQAAAPAVALEDTQESLVAVLMKQVIVSWTNAMVGTLRTRSRLRMLALHLHADSYRRKHGKSLPSLDEIGDQSLTLDCMTGKRFRFESHPREVLIWSPGIGEGQGFGLDNRLPGG